MKTAISIPDLLFEAAEQFAHANGLPRSELFARAVQLYLQAFHYQGITNALNEVYADEPSSLDRALAAAQTRAMPKEDW
jgi:hypothetical protein